jgi:putative membrane protein
MEAIRFPLSWDGRITAVTIRFLKGVSKMMYGFGGLWMLLLVVGVIFVIVWAVQSGTSGRSSDQPRRAIEILEERYARGEIDREEFFSRRSELES